MIRYPALDLIRACACYLVVLLHVSAIQFDAFFPAWPAALIYDSLARMAVPLFFTISGFLLLDSQIFPLTKFYSKRYARILVPFIPVCILYYFTPPYRGFSVAEYISYIFSHFVDYHLWYVYALLGLYLSLPFFIKIIQGRGGIKLAWLYLGIWTCAFICAPAVASYPPPPPEVLALRARAPDCISSYVITDISTNIFSGFSPFFFYGFMGYFICGWLIKHNLQNFRQLFYLFNLIACLAATVAIILATWECSEAAGRPDQTFFNNLSPFVALQSVSFFIFCCQFKREHWLIRDLSDKSYWIYLLHIILLRLLIGLAPLPGNYANIACIPLYALIVFAIAYFAAIPLRALEKKLFNFLKIS